MVQDLSVTLASPGADSWTVLMTATQRGERVAYT